MVHPHGEAEGGEGRADGAEIGRGVEGDEVGRGDAVEVRTQGVDEASRVGGQVAQARWGTHASRSRQGSSEAGGAPSGEAAMPWTPWPKHRAVTATLARCRASTRPAQRETADSKRARVKPGSASVWR